MPNVDANINSSNGTPKTKTPDKADKFHAPINDGNNRIMKKNSTKYKPVNNKPPKSVFQPKSGLHTTAANAPESKAIDTQ